MPGKVVSLRLEADLLERVDVRAKELGRTRTEFCVWALENGLDDAGRGVPDVPAEKPAADAPVDSWHDWALERQRKLNEAKERRR